MPYSDGLGYQFPLTSQDKLAMVGVAVVFMAQSSYYLMIKVAAEKH